MSIIQTAIQSDGCEVDIAHPTPLRNRDSEVVNFDKSNMIGICVKLAVDFEIEIYDSTIISTCSNLVRS